jgi:WD40 repeat protein
LGGEFRVWSVESGQELYALTGDIRAFVFSPDGKKITTQNVVSAGNSKWQVWDAETGKEVALPGEWVISPEVHRSRMSLGRQPFSPDGKWVVTRMTDRTTRVWNADTGKELTLPGKFKEFSPDGKRIVVDMDSGNTIRPPKIWDADSGRELLLTGWFMTFSLDGRKIVTTTRDGDKTRIYDAELGKELCALTGKFSLFSPDEKKIVTVEGNTALVWDADSGEELQKIESDEHFDEYGAMGHQPFVFSHGGEKIVATIRKSEDDVIIRVWDLAAIAAAAKKYRQEILAKAFDLQTELQRSGFEHLGDFVQFGTPALKKLGQGDAFDKSEAEPKIKAAQTEIAQKVFRSEYAYSTADVTVDGDKSSFTMTIPTEFAGATIDEVVFPMQGITGVPATVSPPGGIILSVSGSTDSIRELVRNSGNYQVRVWFKNLQYGKPITADVLKIEIGKK